MRPFLYFFVWILSLSPVESFGQKLERGTIKYEVADFEVSSELLGQTNKTNEKEMKAMVEPMIKGFTQTIAWDGNIQASELNMGGLSTTKVITDLKKKQNNTYMNVMNKRYNISSVIPDAKDKPMTSDFKEFKTERKKIAGYDCYKVVYTVDMSSLAKATKEKGKTKMGSKFEMVAYVTDKIKPSAYLNSTQGVSLNGMPLEYSLNAQGMKLILVAKEVKNSVDKNFFIPPKGYQEITQAEFEQKMMQLGQGK